MDGSRLDRIGRVVPSRMTAGTTSLSGSDVRGGHRGGGGRGGERGVGDRRGPNVSVLAACCDERHDEEHASISQH
jgi:hypothetical protein